jgi:hypothetical protein
MAVLDEGETTCCYARSEKHWVTDPQGIAWEHFHTLDSIPTFSQTRSKAAPRRARAADDAGAARQAGRRQVRSVLAGAAACARTRRARPWRAHRKLFAKALGHARCCWPSSIGSGIMASGWRAATWRSPAAQHAGHRRRLYVLIEVFGPISGAHFNPGGVARDGRARRDAARGCSPYVARSWSARARCPGSRTPCST